MAQIAFEGNLVAPAEVKYSQAGKAVAKARVAENHRGKNPQSGEWEDTGTTWHNVTAFGALAEKLAEVPKGSRLTIQGRQSSRAYDKDGEQRQWTETIADVFGIVPKREQSQQSGYSQPQQGYGQQSGYAQQPPQGDPWQGGGGGNRYDDPPF